MPARIKKGSSPPKSTFRGALVPDGEPTPPENDSGDVSDVDIPGWEGEGGAISPDEE